MFFIIPIVIFVIFVVVVVIIAKKGFKHSGDLKNLIDNDGINSLKNVFSKMNDSIIEATTTNCEYCGSKIEKSEDKCPNCGAGVNNNKK